MSWILPHQTCKVNLLWPMETPQMHHGIYIMGCIWQPFWIQEKVGISFYFWIIRVVNSQLVLYSHVRCNPSLNTPHMTITNFNYEGSYLAGVICNIVVKVNLGRRTPQTNPKTWQVNLLWLMETPQMHHGIYIMGCILQPWWTLQEKLEFPFISE